MLAFDLPSFNSYTSEQRNFDYYSASLSDFLRYFDTSDDQACYILQGHRNGKVEHVKIPATELNENSVIDAMADLSEMGCTDIYMSIQSFKGWRSKNLTWNVNALHVEIDTVEHKQLNESERQQVQDEIEEVLLQSDLPTPQIITDSGSGGLHLYWFINPLSAYDREKRNWLTLSKKLTKTITKYRPENALWKVDNGASHDITRVMRLPQSIHSKSSRVVRIVSNRTNAFDFAELCDLLSVKREVRKECSQHVLEFEPKKIYKKKKNKKRLATKNCGYRTYHTTVVWHLTSFINSGARIHNRDWVLHLLLCSLLQIMDPERAKERILALNNKHVKLTDEELESYMSSTYKKKYIYSKNTLNERFAEYGIPALPHHERSKLDDETRHAVLSDSAHKAAAVKRNASLNKIIDALIMKAGITQAEVAASTGLSLSTVKRHWRAANEQVSQQTSGISKVSLASALYSPSSEHSDLPDSKRVVKLLKNDKKEDLVDKVEVREGRFFKEDTLDMFEELGFGQSLLVEPQSQ